MAAPILAGIVALLALLPAINANLLGAKDSGRAAHPGDLRLERPSPCAHGDAAATGLPPAAIAALRTGHCVKPLFWDPMNEREICHDAIATLSALRPGQLYPMLAGAILRHPFAYAGHRLAHLNATDRWLVAVGWPLAAPPAQSEPNDIGLTDPGPLAASWQRLAAKLAETPLGWPIFWIVAALAGLQSLPRGPMRAHHRLAMALFVSALCQEASFAVLSISSDLRYHLWPMLATALACIIGWDGQTPAPPAGLLGDGAGARPRHGLRGADRSSRPADKLSRPAVLGLSTPRSPAPIRAQLAIMLHPAAGESHGDNRACCWHCRKLPSAPPPPAMLEIDFDLAHPHHGTAAPNEIIVTAAAAISACRPCPICTKDLLPRAEIGFLGGRLALVTQPKELPGGVISNRIMLTWKTKF